MRSGRCWSHCCPSTTDNQRGLDTIATWVEVASDDVSRGGASRAERRLRPRRLEFEGTALGRYSGLALGPFVRGLARGAEAASSRAALGSFGGHAGGHHHPRTGRSLDLVPAAQRLTAVGALTTRLYPRYLARLISCTGPTPR